MVRCYRQSRVRAVQDDAATDSRPTAYNRAAEKLLRTLMGGTWRTADRVHAVHIFR